VFAALDDKDVSSMLAPLLPLVDSVIVTRPEGQSRAREPAELAALVPGAQAIEPVSAALAEAEARALGDGGFVLVAGSLYLVGEVLRRIERG
jgi:dihydrofolate synthase/folylpolyglutamate synthase